MSIFTLAKEWFTRKARPLTDLEPSDLGLSSTLYRRLTSIPVGTRSRMEKLATQFDVTPSMIDADRGLALELAEVCGHCQSTKACQNAVELSVDFNASRCPNAAIYKRLSSTCQ